MPEEFQIGQNGLYIFLKRSEEMAWRPDMELFSIWIQEQIDETASLEHDWHKLEPQQRGLSLPLRFSESAQACYRVALKKQLCANLHATHHD